MKTFTKTFLKNFKLIGFFVGLFSFALLFLFDPFLDNYTYLSYHREYLLIYYGWVLSTTSYIYGALIFSSPTKKQKALAWSMYVLALVGFCCPYNISHLDISSIIHVVFPNISAFGLICLLKMHLIGDYFFDSIIGFLFLMLVFTGYYTGIIEFVFIIIVIHYLNKIVICNF